MSGKVQARQPRPMSLADKLGVVTTALTAVSIGVLAWQVHMNDTTNRVAIRGQLYQYEAGLFAEEGTDEKGAIQSMWAQVPSEITGPDYGQSLLRIITGDPTALSATSAGALFHASYDASVFDDRRRLAATAKLRRAFAYVQSNFYHVHNAYDYWQDGVLKDGEWLTWKGLVAEMNCHPILMMVIWHAHQHRYMSRDFGTFVMEEICGAAASKTKFRARNCAFAKYYYPEMFASGWSSALPTYR